MKISQEKSSTGQNLHITTHDVTNPIAQVIIVHGYAEYSARYHHFIEKLNEANINVIAYDHIGHGLSEGDRAYVNSFDDFLKDMDIVIGKYQNNSLPFFVYAHSMGGLIALRYLQEYFPKIEGIITSGAAIHVRDSIPELLKKMAPLLSKYFPKLQTTKTSHQDVSRDAEVSKKYNEDPLVYHGKVKARIGYEMLRNVDLTHEKVEKFNLPILMMHGSADEVVSYEGTVAFYNNCLSKDKEIKIWEGLYHELINEPEKNEIMEFVIQWITTRLS